MHLVQKERKFFERIRPQKVFFDKKKLTTQKYSTPSLNTVKSKR